MVEIRRLDWAAGREWLPALAAVLVDCVEGGASVGFMTPFRMADAQAFFEGVLEGVRQRQRILLAAFVDSELVGTVQIVTAMLPNQLHRGDVAKLLVARAARRQGVAQRLMEEVEVVSRAGGKRLLVLDTLTGGEAEKLYSRLGWTRVGVIPEYALFPDGRPCDTTIFWKALL